MPFGIVGKMCKCADGIAQASGIDEMGSKFRAGGERRIRIDLEADRFVPPPVGFNKCRPDSGKGIEHRTGTAHVQVDGAFHELPGIARDPRDPPMNGLTAV